MDDSRRRVLVVEDHPNHAEPLAALAADSGRVRLVGRPPHAGAAGYLTKDRAAAEPMEEIDRLRPSPRLRGWLRARPLLPSP